MLVIYSWKGDLAVCMPFQIRELKEELSAIEGKYKFMCDKMSNASQRLYQTNMQRMLSEEEISRSRK